MGNKKKKKEQDHSSFALAPPLFSVLFCSSTLDSFVTEKGVNTISSPLSVFHIFIIVFFFVCVYVCARDNYRAHPIVVRAQSSLTKLPCTAVNEFFFFDRDIHLYFHTPFFCL